MGARVVVAEEPFVVGVVDAVKLTGSFEMKMSALVLTAIVGSIVIGGRPAVLRISDPSLYERE
jgi:hypothetical protein